MLWWFESIGANGELNTQENIIIGGDGFAKLCDFGLAKALDEPTGLTKAGPTQGTLRYMSPELFDEDTTATLASDIWAFACVAGEVSKWPRISSLTSYS